MSNRRRDGARRISSAAYLTAAFAAASLLGAHTAFAAPVTILCEKEATGIPGWEGPLTVTYDGAADGTLSVKSDHIELSLPGRLSSRASNNGTEDVTATTIDGFGETDAKMPGLAALEACGAEETPPDLKDDPDIFSTMAMGCLASVPTSTSPVRIKASVSVGIIPAPNGAPADVIVEMKRTYLSETSAPGGILSVDTFPGNCKTDRK